MVLAAGAGIGWMLWYPMRSACAYLDDYLFLALGVHLRSPAVVLFQDSTGSFFFRPLVMYFWTLSVEAFGTAAPAHLALNIGLHVANAIVLYALARSWRISAPVAALAALAFLVHPAAFSAAAWLSDRFDLFALFFGLACLLALRIFLRTRRTAHLAIGAGLLFAALMSKEVAFAFVPLACAMMLWTGREQGDVRIATRAGWALVLAACSLAAFAARAIALRDVAQPMFLHQGLLAVTVGGAWHWLLRVPGTVFGSHGANAIAFAVQWPLLLLLVAMGLSPRAWRELRSGGLLSCAVLGLGLMAACAVVQAPVMNFFPLDASEPAIFSFNKLAGCRFYYVALAGLCLAAAALAQAAMNAHGRRRIRWIAIALAAIAACGMLAASRGVAREWTAFTERNARWVRAAVAAVQTVRDAKPGCKIYLLGTPASAGAFRAMADTAVKQALAAGDPRMHCFIQSEHTPWYNLVEWAPGIDAGAAPLQEMTLAGKRYPPLRVGNLVYFYLNAGDGPSMLRDPLATFFAWDGERFADVTPRARSGSLDVRFYVNRPLY